MNGKEPTTPERQNQRRGYSPAETAAVRAEAVGEIVSSQLTLLTKSPTKTDLNDITAVQTVAEMLMQNCASIGVLPNFETLAAALGLSRRGLYRHLENHPESETSKYLDRLRTLWAGARQMAMDRGVSDPTTGIFILLNSHLDFSNQHQVEITQPRNPLEVSPETLAESRRRYLAALPDLEDE